VAIRPLAYSKKRLTARGILPALQSAFNVRGDGRLAIIIVEGRIALNIVIIISVLEVRQVKRLIRVRLRDNYGWRFQGL
jgi:hypothetical protein